MLMRSVVPVMKQQHQRNQKSSVARWAMIASCAVVLTLQLLGATRLKNPAARDSRNAEKNLTSINELVLFCGNDGVTNKSFLPGATILKDVSTLLKELDDSHRHGLIMSSDTRTVNSSSTGSLFSGEAFRKFHGERYFTSSGRRIAIFRPGDRYLSRNPLWRANASMIKDNLTLNGSLKAPRFHTTEQNLFQLQLNHSQPLIPFMRAGEISCTNWGVVTTIFAPSEAVRRAAQISPDWCLVVVADTKTPTNYLDRANFTANEVARVHFLSTAWQDNVSGIASDADRAMSAVAKYVRSIPYEHFARKNIGYLYAIAHGAQFIFDFDDDNLLKLDDSEGNRDAVVSPVDSSTHLSQVRFPVLAKDIFNHHPLMGASEEMSWARGFPLKSVLDVTTHGAGVAFETESMSMDRIGVMQICADGNPDVDAIHRLIKPLPMYFAAPSSSNQASKPADLRKPLAVPSHAFAPYNAQATVHTRQAMWAMLLPASVPGRVSDIWRGYFAQAIFRALDLAVVFLPSSVIQDRNEHSYLADMQAELDLYFKVDRLLEYLHDWNDNDNDATGMTVPERMENLWIGLYEREYIEASDVEAVQLWLQALVEVGYEFPRAKRVRYDNVLLMGQFNYATDVKSVLFWVQKWKQVFKHVEVYGPFDQCMKLRLRQCGVKVHHGKADRGYYSPMENLVSALLDHGNRTNNSIDGVLYLHDDAYLNISGLANDVVVFPSQDIIASRMVNKPYQYSDFRMISSANCQGDCFTMKILGNGSFVKVDGTLANTEKELNLTNWIWWGKCIESLRSAALDPGCVAYRDRGDGDSFLIPSPAPADFLFVPIKHAEAFIHASRLMVKHDVFLECGVPTIVQMLRKASNATVRTIPLCSSWTSASRGTDEMLSICEEEGSLNGMYHPLKISKGLQWWSDRFDDLVLY